MSAYRSSAEDREVRRDQLARRLARLRDERAANDGADLAAGEALLLREIRGLDLPPPKTRLSLLARVFSVEAPCTEDWNAMVGSTRVRRCSACDRDVFDLSELTQAEIDALLAAHDAPPCVRMRRRADGTLVTRDACPPTNPSRPFVRVGLGLAAVAIAAGAVYVAEQASADHRHPARVPVTERVPRMESLVMGMMTAPIVRESTPPEPLPPWERPDVVRAGAESVAHFTRLPDEHD